ncbi:hypothetical protein FC777_15545 [Clostridium botulinum]|nr:hypothetical protein [Clostridium botulinum]
MAVAGNSYTLTLNQAHLQWGTHRYTGSRGLIYGEGYLPIPAHVARSFNLYNSNFQSTGLGFNEFNCISADGSFSGVLKSAGCSTKGDIHAKNFQGSGNLKALGNWFANINAQVGDHVEVTWTSPTDIIIRHF